MQLAIEGNLVEDLTAVGFEGRPEVVNVDAAQLGHGPVRHAGGMRRIQKLSTRICAATDDVVTGGNLFQKQGDVCGIVLQIAIHRNNVLAARMIETGCESSSLPEVAAELYHGYAAIHGRDFAQHGERVIVRAVIDQDNLEGLAGGLHHRLQAVI